ncbi:aspartate aminotransferase family protein [Gammaproteobacteria bacterium]|nr:aspartate aminotransferase family protein [Gammaproteobacteria bacterium]
MKYQLGQNNFMGRSLESSTIFSEYEKMNRKSKEHMSRARAVIPSGMSRGLLRHAPFPFYVASGDGCHTVDMDGNRRLDFHGNYTAQIHGHGHEKISKAVLDQLPKGTSYPAPPVHETALAEIICDRIPGVDQVVFNNSGTEAVMVAIRAARAHTGRNRVALFEGCYHGSSDSVLVGGSDLPSPTDAVRVSEPGADMGGLPSGTTKDAVLIKYNDSEAVKEAVIKYGDQLAAIVVEPIMGAGGVIPAKREFLDTIRKETKKHGIVMICDEVISLRQAVGGAQSYYGVIPDMTTMGKIIGGGFPIGGVGGLREFMTPLSEIGTVANLGTFSANPISMCAGVAGMEALDEGAIADLNRQGDLLRAGMESSIQRSNAGAQVSGVGSLFWLHWTEMPVDCPRIVEQASSELSLLTYIGLLNRGVQVSARGMACLSTPMEDGDIELFIAALDDTLEELKRDAWI